jgi:hypothetical protein
LPASFGVDAFGLALLHHLLARLRRRLIVVLRL